MNKIILKVNSWISIAIGIMIMLLAITYMLFFIFNSRDDLGKIFIFLGTSAVCILCLPLLVSGIGTLNYLNGKSTYKLCMTFNVIGITLNVLFICFNILNRSIDAGLTITISVIYICLLATDMIGLYKEKKSRQKNSP